MKDESFHLYLHNDYKVGDYVSKDNTVPENFKDRPVNCANLKKKNQQQWSKLGGQNPNFVVTSLKKDEWFKIF